MTAQPRAEGDTLHTDTPPPDVLVFPGPKVPVTNYVDSFGWRCCLCGWLGVGHYAVEAAMKEAHLHMKSDHPDMESVNVEMLKR